MCRQFRGDGGAQEGALWGGAGKEQTWAEKGHSVRGAERSFVPECGLAGARFHPRTTTRWPTVSLELSSLCLRPT